MSTKQQTQLLHLNQKPFSNLALVVLVVVGSLLMGLVPAIYGLSSTDTQGANLIIPTEAELWSPLGGAREEQKSLPLTISWLKVHHNFTLSDRLKPETPFN